jgi:hypothetical protein
MYVSNNPMDSISNLLQVVRPKMVLFAANNKPFFLKKWKQECDVMGIAYFSIKEKGAYVCDVNQLFNFL